MSHRMCAASKKKNVPFPNKSTISTMALPKYIPTGLDRVKFSIELNKIFPAVMSVDDESEETMKEALRLSRKAFKLYELFDQMKI